MPRGPRPVHDRAIVCAGLACAQKSRAAAGSAACSYGLCLKCCVNTHQQTQNIPPCSERRHHAAFTKTQCGDPHQSNATNTPGAAVAPTSSSNVASQVPERFNTYAIPLSATYQQRLHDLDNEQLETVNTAATNRTYQRQQNKTVTVKWWEKVSIYFTCHHYLVFHYNCDVRTTAIHPLLMSLHPSIPTFIPSTRLTSFHFFTSTLVTLKLSTFTRKYG